jgi:hypothetical protein
MIQHSKATSPRPMRHASLSINVAILLLTMQGQMSHAAQPNVAAEPTIEFIVASSDTLIGLSSNVLVSARAWREVAAINKLPNPNRIYPGQVLRIPARLMRGDPVNATLVSVVGDVRSGDAPAVAGATIVEGQSVQTGAASSAVVELADGSRIRLPPSSLAQVAASRTYGQRSSSGSSSDTSTVASASAVATSSGWFAGTLRILRGSVEVIATKVLRAKPLEVVTPTAVVGVRGTVFRVGLEFEDGTVTHSEVLEGAVRMESSAATSSSDRPPQAAASVQVAAGYGAVIDATARAPEVAKLLPPPDLSPLPDRFERPVVRFALPAETTPLRVQVASDAQFEKLVSDQRATSGADVRIGDLEDAPWYLRMRRIDARGIEGFDATRSFVLKARPEPPAYVTPRADAKQTLGTLEFAWLANASAPRARLQVAEDADFSRIVQEQDNVDTTRLRATIPTAGTYYWRLASIRPDGDHGPFGDPQRFELRPTPEPPTAGTSGDGNSLNFRWKGRPEDRQQVQLARDPEFTKIVAQDELTTSEWSLPKPASSGRYYFRYRTIEPDGFVSAYSQTLQFDVPRDWTGWLLLLPLVLLL